MWLLPSCILHNEQHIRHQDCPAKEAPKASAVNHEKGGGFNADITRLLTNSILGHMQGHVRKEAPGAVATCHRLQC